MGFTTFGKKSSKKSAHGDNGRTCILASQSDAIFNTVSDGIVIIDDKGIINLFNHGAAVMTGWTQADAVNLDFRSIFQFFDVSEHKIPDAQNPILMAMNSDKPTKLDNVFLKTASGRYLRISVQVTPIEDGNNGHKKSGGLFDFLNKPIGAPSDKAAKKLRGASVVVTFRDITSQQNENHRQSDFISTASHEMRTPVAVIEGYLGMLLNPNTATIDSRGQEYARKAHEAAQHLGHLFQDLLDVTQLDDNRMRSNLILVDAGTAARQAVERMQSQAVAKGLNLFFEASGEIQPMYIIYADLDHLQEVIDNLIENAIKYTPKGSVKVSIEDNNGKVKISVTDTGIGIPAEDVPHLFQKFYRVDNRDTRDIGGTGLGLYLIKKLSEHMGGRVGVESRYGSGSTFWVEFDRLSRDQAIAKAHEIRARKAA